MSDLIERQAAIDFIDAGHLCNPNEPRWSDNEVVNFLKSRPSAQAKLDENDMPEQGDSAKFGVKTGETCTDCISRQAAIVALREVYEYEYPTASGGFDEYATKLVPNTLKNLPSAQPEITEQQVKKYCEKRCLVVLDSSLFHRLKSAQPDRRYDEWCTDCKEYDQEKHCCPRWNRVIRTTLQDAQRTGRWKVSDLPKGKMKYCSECGFGQYIADERQYNFCPNCGAKMEVEE